MKRNKLLAIIMAAALAATGTGQTAGVLAADFTDAEVFVSVEPEETAQEPAAEDQAAQEEAAAIFAEDAEADIAEFEEAEPEDAAQEMEETGETDAEFAEMEVPGEEALIQGEEDGNVDGAEIPDEAVPEEDIFSAGEPEEAFADGGEEELLEATAAKADYRGLLISKEMFDNFVENEEAPEGEWIESKGISFAEFMKGFAGKTGYLLVAAENNEGYEDLVIPEGLTVVLACGQRINIKSVTPNGNLFVRERTFTPGSLEVKGGKGSVTFSDCPIEGGIAVNGSMTLKDTEVRGIVTGAGSNDTVTFGGNGNDVNGIQGVENIIFTEHCIGLAIRNSGKAEFYNIQNKTNAEVNEGDRDRDIYLSIENYNQSSVPVFHKDFDLGTNIRVYDDKVVDEWPAGIFVGYIKDIDPGEELRWDDIDVGLGKPVVKFDNPDDAEVIKICEKVQMAGYGIDIDGTTFSGDNGKRFEISRYQSSEGMSDKEIFEAVGRKGTPNSCEEYLITSGTLENVLRIVAADQKNSKGKYYRVMIPRDYKVSGALTVPSGVDGMLYTTYLAYEEETDTMKYYPVQVNAVNVPVGKTVRLMNFQGGSGALNLTGTGTVELTNCRMNQDITGAAGLTVNMEVSTAKSLTCDKMRTENTWIAVEKGLKFNEANLLNTDLVAMSGAVLDFGAINNEGSGKGSFAIDLQVKNGQFPSVTFAKPFNLGNVDMGGNSHEAIIDIRFWDYAKTAALNANCSKDIYDMKFMPWDEESKSILNNLVKFDNKAVSLLTLCDESGKNMKYMLGHLLIGFEGISLTAPPDKVANGKCPLYSWDKELKASNSYITFKGNWKKTSIAKATVENIKDQTYTGKEIKPAVTVTLNGTTLKNGMDYLVSYQNNTKVGTATVTITGIVDYEGSISKTFKIVSTVPKKGDKATVGTLKYQVTKSASKGGTVSVIAPKSKNSTSITIPATVKINGYTFNVTAIAANAFKGCTKLKSVTIGSKVTTIGAQAFYGCKNLTKIKVSASGLKSVGKNALKGINAKATISVSYSKLGTYKETFAGKGQSKTVKIINPVPAKGKAVKVSGLKYKITKSASKNGTVTLTGPVKTTNTSITIPSTVKIEGYTFKVTAVGTNAFKSNTKLAKVTVGANVTTIGKQAFYGCKKLKTITVKTKSLKTIGTNAFKGIYKKAVIKVPSAKLTAYKNLFKNKGQSSTVKITK